MDTTCIRLPEQWIPQDDGGEVANFVNAVGDQLELSCMRGRPDLQAGLDDPSGLWKFYRALAERYQLALLEAEASAVDGVPAVRMILKAPQEPTGFTFIGSHTVVFSDRSFMVKVQCPELGMTGLRESLVKIAFAQPSAWDSDPYEPAYRSPFMRTGTDDPAHDAKFPDHPLTRLRAHLAEIAGSSEVDPNVKRLPRFVFGAKPKPAFWSRWRH